jgi:hypothetical protein
VSQYQPYRRFAFGVWLQPVTAASSAGFAAARLAVVGRQAELLLMTGAIGRRQRRRRRQYRSRAGPSCRGPGRIASWSSDPRERRLPAHSAAEPRHQTGGNERMLQRMRRHRLDDPRLARHSADNPPAPCRSRRRPPAVTKTGPPACSPIARAARGASGIVTTLPPLRVTTSVRCPRSTPRCSISAPLASRPAAHSARAARSARARGYLRTGHSPSRSR